MVNMAVWRDPSCNAKQFFQIAARQSELTSSTGPTSSNISEHIWGRAARERDCFLSWFCQFMISIAVWDKNPLTVALKRLLCLTSLMKHHHLLYNSTGGDWSYLTSTYRDWYLNNNRAATTIVALSIRECVHCENCVIKLTVLCMMIIQYSRVTAFFTSDSSIRI